MSSTDADEQIVAIPKATWKHDGALDRRIEVEVTVVGDDVAEVGIRGIADGLMIRLNADQLDEIASDFQARAALMRGAR